MAPFHISYHTISYQSYKYIYQIYLSKGAAMPRPGARSAPQSRGAPKGWGRSPLNNKREGVAPGTARFPCREGVAPGTARFPCREGVAPGTARFPCPCMKLHSMPHLRDKIMLPFYWQYFLPR